MAARMPILLNFKTCHRKRGFRLNEAKLCCLAAYYLCRRSKDQIGSRCRHQCDHEAAGRNADALWRSEEHTSELQSLMRISYAVFCLKTQNTHDEKEYQT